MNIMALMANLKIEGILEWKGFKSQGADCTVFIN